MILFSDVFTMWSINLSHFFPNNMHINWESSSRTVEHGKRSSNSSREGVKLKSVSHGFPLSKQFLSSSFVTNFLNREPSKNVELSLDTRVGNICLWDYSTPAMDHRLNHRLLMIWSVQTVRKRNPLRSIRYILCWCTTSESRVNSSDIRKWILDYRIPWFLCCFVSQAMKQNVGLWRQIICFIYLIYLLSLCKNYCF